MRNIYNENMYNRCRAQEWVAAINVANENNEVFILEHTSKIGSKIRISGNGKMQFD